MAFNVKKFIASGKKLKNSKLKKGKWGGQSLDHIKRRTTSKKKIRAKILKYKRKGYTPKNRLK
jgi:hypothetical protein